VPTGYLYGAFVVGQVTRDALEECRLPGPVIPQQAHDLPSMDYQIGSYQGSDVPEGL
jgi:hypothetical protein